MGRQKKIIKIVTLSSIGIMLFSIGMMSEGSTKSIKVVNWDNVYKGNSINIIYDDTDKRLEVLNTTYGVSEIVNDLSDDLSKALKVSDIANSIVQCDDVEDSGYFSGYNILRSLGDSKKVSKRDMAIIARDILATIGFTVRVGEFRNNEGYFGKDNNYYVIEFWNEAYNKWIMIDVLEKGYFINSGVPCSAIEVLTTSKKELDYLGKGEKKDYFIGVGKIFGTYTIAIDNTMDMKKSNTFVTFVNSERDITLEHNNKYLPPTIFTDKTDIFNKAPNEEIDLNDSSINIVIMKNEGENNIFTIGGFKDSKIVNEYYIKINEKEFEMVNKYKEIEIGKGINTIELSQDGIESECKIEIKSNNK